MTRVVSVGRSKSLLAAGAVGFAFLTLTLAGCPGTLSPDFTGGMGTAGTGSPAGTAGGGTAGMTAGTGGVPGCDITPLIQPNKYWCIQTGACHDGSAATAAGMSMQKADWPKLVGGMPNGKNASICGNDPNFKSMPYIIKGGDGSGLLLMKLNAAICSPMGAQMPTLGGPMAPADKTCFQQWAAAMAKM
jgi:hypothetical protein